MQIRPTAFTIGLIIYSFIALFFVYTEFGIDSNSVLFLYVGADIIRPKVLFVSRQHFIGNTVFFGDILCIGQSLGGRYLHLERPLALVILDD